MQQTLIDRSGGTAKTWSIRRSGTEVFKSNAGGKERMKSFESAEEAAKHVKKEVWSRLKKGFVLSRPEAGPGEPVMHRYVGGGYTGFMPLAPIAGGNQVYISYVVNQFEKEEIRLLDAHGDMRTIIGLPGGSMIYEMVYVPEREELLVNRDHRIYAISLKDNRLQPLTHRLGVPASTLSVSGKTAVWYNDSQLVVSSLDTGEAFYTDRVKPELYRGHSTQLCAALSPDGSLLAYSVESNQIVLCDLKTNQRSVLAKKTPSLTSQLRFAPGNRYLFALEQFGDWNLQVYDLAALKLDETWPLEGIKQFAIHEDKQLLAVYRYEKIRLIDLTAKRLTLEFPVEHIVKKCSLAFTRDYLAVYTDYGCASLYALP
ncbi:hypothetical protein ACE6ED_12290 [Paenibacillus sp. CN-4]|uniref:hypothetical protein n=1 Tax=Paenibacillus nanchangensis TaxID=3348343 RepID=UPI00397DFB80